MRKPDPIPPMVVISESTANADSSSVSISEPFLHPPQQYRKYFNMRVQQHTGNTTTRKRTLRRSTQLQSTLDRIEGRNCEPTQLSNHRQPQLLESDPVEQVQDMFSTYDAVLDHLVRKNRNLKSYVRYRSNRFPNTSDLSYTSSEVMDTLESLRWERENALRPIPGRRAVSQPRPSRVEESAMWQSNYDRHQNMYRDLGRLGVPRQGLSGIDRRWEDLIIHEQDWEAMERANFETDRRIMGQNRGRQHHHHHQPIIPQDNTPDYKRQTRDLLQVMQGFKKEDTVDQFQSLRKLPRNGQPVPARSTTTNSFLRDSQLPKIGGNEDIRYRYTRSASELPHSTAPRGAMQYQWDDLDPIEMMRSRQVGGYEDPKFTPHPRNYYAYERNSIVASERGESQTNSEVLSKLLPERIPPKIKASRDRLARFRSSRLRSMQNDQTQMEWRDDVSPLRQSISPLRKRHDTRQDDKSYPAEPTRVAHGLLRPGSPERPLNLSNFDSYGRRIGLKQAGLRSGEYRCSTSRNTKQDPRLMAPAINQCNFRDTDSQDSALTPSAKARELISQVNEVYQFSKEMRETNEKMKEELSRIKQIYITGSDSLNELYESRKLSINDRSQERHRLSSSKRASVNPRRSRPHVRNLTDPLPTPPRVDRSQYRSITSSRPSYQQHPVKRLEQSTLRERVHGDLGAHTSPVSPAGLPTVESSPRTRVIHPPRFSFVRRVEPELNDPPDGLFDVCSDDLSVDDGRVGDEYYSSPKRASAENDKQLPAYDKSLISCSSEGSSSHERQKHLDGSKSESDEEEPIDLSRAKQVHFQDPVFLTGQRRRRACCG